jgi:DNA-binding MarR family transcriptional regulator
MIAPIIHKSPDRTRIVAEDARRVKQFLASERKAKTGRALLLHLTPKGEKYHQGLVQRRRSADDRARELLTADERSTLTRLLKLIAEMEF